MMHQSETLYKSSFLPDKDALLEKYLGKSLDTLRTPAMIIDCRLFAQNCSSMHLKAREWGASFRAHLKTHKVGLVGSQCSSKCTLIFPFRLLKERGFN